MPDFTNLITWEVLLFLLLLFGVVAVQLLTGQINTRRLLAKKEGDGSFSPERVQLLLATIAAAFGYLSQVLKEPTQFPQVPRSWLVLLGGSHTLYLGRRFYLTRSTKQKDS
jgi:hypothetical protein